MRGDIAEIIGEGNAYLYEQSADVANAPFATLRGGDRYDFGAQQQAPTFEVASIKPNKGLPYQDSSWGYPPGRFLVRNMHMRWVIAMVYGEPHGFLVDRVLGGPSWLDGDRYDIEGKAIEPDPSEALLRAMARSLLEKRLALKTHVEQRDLPLYALVDDGTGRLRGQLRASDGRDCAEASQPSSEKLPDCGLASSDCA